MTQSDKGLVKIADGASPRQHAETGLAKGKDTHLIKIKLRLAAILYEEWKIKFVIDFIDSGNVQLSVLRSLKLQGWHNVDFVVSGGSRLRDAI